MALVDYKYVYTFYNIVIVNELCNYVFFWLRANRVGKEAIAGHQGVMVRRLPRPAALAAENDYRRTSEVSWSCRRLDQFIGRC